MTLRQLETFRFMPDQAASMRSEFTLVLSGTDLSKSGALADVIATHKKVPGIYFWVLRHQGAEFRIYVGKTNSLSYRLVNYVSEFQPHSPNDYKLRIFTAFTAEFAPDGAYDLYFKKTDLAGLTQAENAAIAAYRPLLNQLPSASPEAKARLKEAFGDYYRSSFQRCLADQQTQDF